jgi:signal transduction histidine kinase
MVEDLLDLAKIERGSEAVVHAVNAETVTQCALQTVDGLAVARRITIVRRAGASAIDVVADGDRLEQVLVNVLSNAIKFSPEDTTVTVGWRLSDRWAECVVSDEGPGIPRDQLERIFDKFRQIGSASTRQHGGAGLGLAISRRLVDSFGGKIWAESEPGKGSCFIVRLRLAT